MTKLLRSLTTGGTVRLAFAIEAEIETGDGRRSTLPLTRKTARVLTEHAALAQAYLDNTMDIINADRETK